MKTDSNSPLTASGPSNPTSPVRPSARSRRLATRPFLLLISAHFLQAVGWSSMLLLPLYLDHLGASRAEIGAIMAAAAIGGLAVRPLIGWSLDSLGRKPTLVTGTLFLVSSMALLATVQQIGPLVYVDRIVFGIGEAALFTGYFAFAADIIPIHRRTEGIALFGIAGLVPLAINPLVGETDIPPADLRWVFAALSLLVLLSLVPLIRVPEAARSQFRRRLLLAEVLQALRQRRLAPVWVATVLFAALVAIFMAFSTVCAESRGVARPAAIWFSYSAGAIGVRLLGARLPDRIGPSNLIAPALGLFAFATVLAAGAWSTGDFLLAGLLAGLGHGYSFPILTGQVVTRTPDHVRGSALAMYTALWSLTALALTPVFGAVADRFDDATMFSLTALVAVASLAIWATLEHRFGGAARPQPEAT